MLARRWWGTSTPLYRYRLLADIGPITDLLNEEDWEYDCRLAAKGVELARVREVVSEQREIASVRASEGGATDPAKLRDRARARHYILRHAQRAGVSPRQHEFQEFVSYSFLLARQCAAAGLTEVAKDLVEQLQAAAPRKLMRTYLLAGTALGFERATAISEWAYRLLRGHARGSAS